MGIAEYKVQMQQFSSNQYVQGSKEFLQSNGIVAKFAFLILVLILFIMLLSLGSAILGRVFAQTHNPILIPGMIRSNQMMVIPQDPSKKGAKPILRSNNEREGLEFTWSVWINIDDFGYKQNEFKHVFHKGNNNISNGSGGSGGGGGVSGINYPNNSPGLYITPLIPDASNGNTAGLLVKMNSFNQIDEDITIAGIPLNKWVNIIIRVTKQNQLDVYINGTLVKRHMLAGVPKQNYGDVYASLNGGFSGNTSELRYFEKAISTSKIQSIVNAGPSTKLITGASVGGKDDNKYISTRWYLQTAQSV
jgi:hypothetical protein